MKPGIVSVLLALMCIGVISCKRTASPFGKSPGEVVKEYYRAANEGRYSDAKGFLSKDAQKAMDGDLGALAGGFKKICDEDTKEGTITKVDVIHEEIRGEGAKVIVNIFFKDGTEKQGDESSLIQESGSWKLTL